MIKLMIADDHQLIIDGLKTNLSEVSDIDIIAEANNGNEVLKVLNRKKPDVILMDINMPEMDGLECTRLVSRKYPRVRVIGLSQFDEVRLVKRLVKNGAVGYLLKDTGLEELISAIRKVHSGEKYFSEKLSLNLIDQDAQKNTNSLFPKLSGREREILQLICQEYSSQEIAERLNISFHTIESHRVRLMMKAGARNTAGLVRWAVESGQVD